MWRYISCTVHALRCTPCRPRTPQMQQGYKLKLGPSVIDQIHAASARATPTAPCPAHRVTGQLERGRRATAVRTSSRRRNSSSRGPIATYAHTDSGSAWTALSRSKFIWTRRGPAAWDCVHRHRVRAGPSLTPRAPATWGACVPGGAASGRRGRWMYVRCAGVWLGSRGGGSVAGPVAHVVCVATHICFNASYSMAVIVFWTSIV